MTAVHTRLSEELPGIPTEEGYSDTVVAVTRPTSAQDVARLVTWARGQRVALHPRSSRRETPGILEPSIPSVVVDLSGMKRIIRVDRRNRVALFEAGVTFEELVPAVEATGLRMHMPLCPPEGRSVLATYLDREPVIMPRYQWDLSDPLLCLEVVFGTGHIFRTGSAAGPGALEEQWAAGDAQKGPMGPGHVDFMRLIQGAQGSIGIATWASVKAEAKPDVETAFIAGAESLSPLVDVTYSLLRRRAVDICFIVDRNALADLLRGADHERREMEQQASTWNLVLSVSGAGYLAERWHDYRQRLTHEILIGAGVSPYDPPECTSEALLDRLCRPSTGRYWKDRRCGAFASLFFQTTLDRVESFHRLLASRAAASGIEPDRTGFYIQPQLGGRLCHFELIVACAPDSPQEADAKRFVDDQVADLVGEGAFFSRPYRTWAGPALAASSAFPVYEKVKSIFDPDRILAPGLLGLKGNPDGYLA